MYRMEEFRVVQRRKLYQDIVGQIGELIREGVLRPGDRLPPERDLAERLQVSRSSLREAMRTLELQGLVVSRPGAGTFVSTGSLDGLISIIASSLANSGDAQGDIFEVRHLLEPEIAALAARRATEEDMGRMIVALEQQEAQLTRGETGVEGDTTFHFAMAQATQNWALVKVISTISDILSKSRDQTLHTPGRPERSLASHKQILDTIRRCDPEGARSAMEHHLLEVEPVYTPVGERPKPLAKAVTELAITQGGTL